MISRLFRLKQKSSGPARLRNVIPGGNQAVGYPLTQSFVRHNQSPGHIWRCCATKTARERHSAVAVWQCAFSVKLHTRLTEAPRIRNTNQDHRSFCPILAPTFYSAYFEATDHLRLLCPTSSVAVLLNCLSLVILQTPEYLHRPLCDCDPIRYASGALQPVRVSEHQL